MREKMEKFITPLHRFMGSSDNAEEAKAIIFGLPMDWTVSFRPGSRFGPPAIRQASWVHEEYSHYLNKELSEINYYDAGDLDLFPGNAEKSLQQIRGFVKELLLNDKIPIALGGEHLVSWPIIEEVYKKYNDLAVIHIDAHADLRDSYEGETYSHATPLYKTAELIGGHNLYQFGIRSMTKQEVMYVKEKRINFHPFEVIEHLGQELKKLQGRNVYITIDIDAVDPAHAPGTGTPEPGGITSKEMLAVIHQIANADINIVGTDLVEVAPVYDHSEQTAILAAKMVREILLGFIK